MAELPKKLRHKLQQRQENETYRELKTAQGKVDLVSNDYLGLAKNDKIFRGAIQLLESKGAVYNGSTGSRLLSGNSQLYEETEEYLAKFYEEESALIFNSGYDANLGIFSTVPQRGDLVFFDEYIHASMRDGIRMGLAKSHKFKHNDLNDLTELLRRTKKDITSETHCYIATEAVFSMDGDSPNLEALLEICDEFQCKLILDEAHAIEGIGKTKSDLRNEGLDKGLIFARIVTFGKAVGIQGSAILGSQALKEYLLNYARSFIYTTALPPMTIASILYAYRQMDSDEVKQQKTYLQANIEFLHQEIKKSKLKDVFIPSNSAIHSCVIPGNKRVKKVAQSLSKRGFDLRPILAPTVPEGKERIRICLHSFNTEEEIKEVLSILAYAIDEKIHT